MTERRTLVKRSANSILGMVAVLAIAIICQSSGAESPALAAISAEWPDVPMTTITMITTIPVLMMIPSSLFFSFFRNKIRIRPTACVFMLITIVGGVLPAWADSIGQILIGRAIFGLGMGIMWPMAQALVIELYEGNKQDKMLGYNNLVVAVGGVIWANVGGVLATYSWRYSFFAYFIPIAVMIFIMLFLPEPPKPKERVADEPAKEGKKNTIGGLAILLVVYFLFNFGNMVYYTNLAMKVIGEGLGNEANSGFAQSINLVGAIVIGLIFGYLMKNKTIKQISLGIGWLFVALGFIIVGFAGSFAMVVFGSFFCGWGTGWFMPTILGMFGRLGGNNAAVFIGISACVLGFSQFVGPLIINAITGPMGDAGIGRIPLLMAGGLHLVCGAVALIVCIILKNKKTPNIINTIE